MAAREAGFPIRRKNVPSPREKKRDDQKNDEGKKAVELNPKTLRDHDKSFKSQRRDQKTRVLLRSERMQGRGRRIGLPHETINQEGKIRRQLTIIERGKGAIVGQNRRRGRGRSQEIGHRSTGNERRVGHLHASLAVGGILRDTKVESETAKKRVGIVAAARVAETKAERSAIETKAGSGKNPNHRQRRHRPSVGRGNGAATRSIRGAATVVIIPPPKTNDARGVIRLVPTKIVDGKGVIRTNRNLMNVADEVVVMEHRGNVEVKGAPMGAKDAPMGAKDLVLGIWM